MKSNASINFLFTLFILMFILFPGVNLIRKQTAFLKSKVISNSIVCRKCNVVIIDIDLLRGDAMDCKENFSKTPNLCNFLENSAYFSNNIGQSDLTRTSLASTLTSLYPISHGIWNELYFTNNPELTTLPEVLASDGYITAAYGHLNKKVFLADGFNIINTIDNIHSGKPEPDKILKNLSDKGKPFFLFIHLESLHEPFLTPDYTDVVQYANAPLGYPRRYTDLKKDVMKIITDEYKNVFTALAIEENSALFSGDVSKKQQAIYDLFEKYDEDLNTRTKYLNYYWPNMDKAYRQYINPNNPNHIEFLKSIYIDELVLVDNNLSKLLNMLNSESLKSKTIVLLISEHGEEFFEHGRIGHGNNLYDELLKTPMYIKTPNGQKKLVTGLTENIDIYPTVLDIIGKSIPQKIQGTSLVPLLLNTDKSVRAYQIAQKGQGEYVSVYRKKDWKLIIRDGVPYELYFLNNDPGETTNLITEKAEIAADMLQEYGSIVYKLPTYETKNIVPSKLDEKERERLKDEGYF